MGDAVADEAPGQEPAGDIGPSRGGDDGPSMFSLVAMVQGLFYVATGLWPFVSMELFLRVTGSKEDLWLVQTVAALIVVIGASLVVASLRRRPRVEVAVLGAGSALALGAVDVFFVLGGVISPVYLLDAAAEAALLVAWVVVSAATWLGASGRTTG